MMRQIRVAPLHERVAHQIKQRGDPAPDDPVAAAAVSAHQDLSAGAMERRPACASIRPARSRPGCRQHTHHGYGPKAPRTTGSCNVHIGKMRSRQGECGGLGPSREHRGYRLGSAFVNVLSELDAPRQLERQPTKTSPAAFSAAFAEVCARGLSPSCRGASFPSLHRSGNSREETHVANDQEKIFPAASIRFWASRR